jgi:hypothetical protein
VDTVGQPKQALGYLPGLAFELKVRFEAKPIPVGTDFLLIVGGEFGLKLEFKT